MAAAACPVTGQCRVGSLKPRAVARRSCTRRSAIRTAAQSLHDDSRSSSGAGSRPLQRQGALKVRSSTQRPPVDPDLLEVLDLASNDELEELYSTLHGRSLFSPLLKSLSSLVEGESSGAPATRDELIAAIDRRLRYLAADSGATLRGRWPPYRQVLLMLRDKLGIACSPDLLTNELEAEVFLHLLEQHGGAVGAAGASGGRTQVAAEYACQGDGGAGGMPPGPAPGVLDRLLAPLRLGQDDMMPALAHLGGALAVSNLVRDLGVQLVRSNLRYEAALSLALSAGSRGLQGSLQGRVAVQAAKEGITHAAGRYAAARSLLSVLGPVMWAATALELLHVSVGTDWSRVARAVFALAQIRLLRTYGFSMGRAPGSGSAPGSL